MIDFEKEKKETAVLQAMRKVLAYIAKHVLKKNTIRG